jgi:hypothetical protein
MSTCGLYSSAIGMCNLTRQRGMYVGTWSITSRRYGADPAARVSRAGEAKLACRQAMYGRTVRVAEGGGMPFNGAFQGRETFPTRDRFVPMPWMPGSFAFAAEVLEMWWSQWSGSGSGILGGRGEVRNRMNRWSRIKRR